MGAVRAAGAGATDGALLADEQAAIRRRAGRIEDLTREVAF